jgi:serpin B
MSLKKIELTAVSSEILHADNQFGFELFKQVISKQDDNQNTLVSPLSVALALTMTYNGAADSTASAMEETLYLSGMEKDEINKSYKELIESLFSADPKVTMEIANSIWYRDDFSVKDNFLELNKDYFDAEVSALDFDDSKTPDWINEWVSEKTHHKIQEVVTEIDPETVMYLINALYFNGKWKYQFEQSKTMDGLFYLPDGITIETPMMHLEAELSVYACENFQAVELPYGRGNYNMICMLPTNSLTADDLAMELTQQSWDQMLNEFVQQKTNIYLPRFEFEYKNELRDELSEMGMERAFDPDLADFEYINSEYQLFISKVLQKTYIKLDEKGTEAAAVTSVEVGLTSAGPPNVIRFNHPFLFAIYEKSTGGILFMGKMINPSA